MNEIRQISEKLAWEGVVGAPAALTIWLILAVLAAWFLWRERLAVGPRWAAAFWVLRMIAFGFALWMLAGPTQLRIERSTTNQSIAIFADGSDSMEIVDPPDASENLRWALAVDDDGDDSPVVRADRLMVALGTALSQCRQLAQYVDEHRSTKQIAVLVNSIGTAVDRASSHAESLMASLGRREKALEERASRITLLLAGPVVDSLSGIQALLAGKESEVAAGEDFVVRLEQLVESVKSAHRRSLIFAADISQRQFELNQEGAAEFSGYTRREKTGRALDALEQKLARELAENVRIDRYRFDRTATPVSAEGGWAHALENQSTADDDEPEFQSESDAAPEGMDDADAAGPATNLSAVLEQLASEQAGRSARLAVLLSDGRHNDVDAPAPQELATQLVNVPVYVVPIGNAIEQRDVLLHRVEAPSAVAEKDSAVIDIIVTGFDCEGQATNVLLRHEGREVDRKEIQFRAGRGDQRVRFMVPAKEAGWQEYIVEVEPVEEEANTANNYQPVSFEVVREQLRVLLTDGVARWEYRYLNQLFRRDEHVQFDELLFYPRVHGTGALAERLELPRDVDGWSRYDVVILGDIGPQQLPSQCQRALRDFVRDRGGNLIVMAGQNSMPAAFQGEPLMDLLPVERARDVMPQQGYSLQLTEEGRFHSALLISDSAQDSRQEWKRIYGRFPVYGLSDYSRPKSTARALIEAVPEATGLVNEEKSSVRVDHAFLCWQRVGGGRVAYLAAPDTYRLRWRRGDRMHHRFWGQFLRWITAAASGTGSDVVRLQTDRTRYSAGEPVEVTVWLKDRNGRPLEGESLQAEARTFDGKSTSVELTPDTDVPGRYFGTLSELAAGAYQVSVRGKVIDELMPKDEDDATQATITVRAVDSIEMLNTHSNRALLEQVAQITNGQVIPPTAISEVMELVSFTPEVSEAIERTPLWNRWSNLFIVLGCLITEWVVRKSKGLV